jgi:hypothetical protein
LRGLEYVDDKTLLIWVMATVTLKVLIKSRIRIFPEIPPPLPNDVPLSIIDSTVARFSPTAAVWVYEEHLSIDHLIISLKRTLNAYPQWAGQLHWTTYDPRGDHTNRQGRLALSYGTGSDPGVACTIARSPLHVSSLYPCGIDEFWNAGQVPTEELLDASTPLAMHDLVNFEGLPGMVVQMTTFGCGGVAVAVKMAHPLADAQALLTFMRDWAAVNCSVLSGGPTPSLTPVFDPSLLDQAAGGDIDAPEQDLVLLEAASPLPLHRYDWWASADGCPQIMASGAQIPSALEPTFTWRRGTPLPWSQWNITIPVDHYLLYFTPREVEGIWEEASTAARVSHLDALLSHIWALVIRARGLDAEEEHHLDITFGLRSRLSPPLPDSFLGSPITIAAVKSTGSQASSNSVGTMASSIRSALQKFTPSNLSALLHEVAYYASAQRYWNGFLGTRNTIVTSWLRLGVYELSFDGTSFPRCVLFFQYPMVLLTYLKVCRTRDAKRRRLYPSYGGASRQSRGSSGSGIRSLVS